MKFATKLYDNTHLSLGMLLHYLGKLKIQISCRHPADMEENVNKLLFKCIDFNSSVRMTACRVYFCGFIKILSSSLNIMLVDDKHCCDVCCDEFPVP